MASITERNKQKIELANNGFTMNYIDEWQPKTTLYRHKASYNTEGDIVGDIGSTVKQVPGNPDYVLKKSKIGLFPWKPSSECDCQWCGESFAKVEVPVETLLEGDTATETCNICGFKMEAKNKLGLSSKVRSHNSKVHSK
tara:strand:- start:1423 stop:1842 length:420 start_codon:yes stop_codon:yes gene_type:complete